MSRLLSITVLAAAAVLAAPSPSSLNSDITLLIDNDLQGKSTTTQIGLRQADNTHPGAFSPTADSAVIVLGEPRSYRDAAAACQALAEELWYPELGTAGIQSILDYIKYSKIYPGASQFWIGAKQNTTRAIDDLGHLAGVGQGANLPVLCTQTAPFSNETSEVTSEKWQVTVHSNNEYLTG
jgi:hypothetical protein